MATVREGHRPVLLVVDVQVGVMAEAWEAPRVVANVARTVERARARGVPVIWVQHGADDLQPNTPAWQWVPELAPAPGETRIHKRFNSAFEDTALLTELDRLQVSRIFLAGAATNWCIRATAYGALDRGFDVTVLGGAHTTEDMELESGRVVEARGVVDDFNVTMRWLAYPGRTNAVATAATAAFA